MHVENKAVRPGLQIALDESVNSTGFSAAVSDVAGWLASDGGFGVLPSRARPRLLLPLDSRTAAHASVNLYNGHWTRKGRIKRRLFHIAVSLGARVYGHDRVVPPKDADSRFVRLVHEVTGEPRPCFAALLRTKIWTTQLSNLIVQAMRPDGQILGFLKVPLTPETDRFTRDEVRNLQRLSAVPDIAASVPRILYAGEWEGNYVLFQSALSGSPSGSLTSAHLGFLNSLRRIDLSIRGPECLLSEMTALFEEVEDHVSREARQLSRRTLQWAEAALRGASVEYGFTHGDFSPSHALLKNGDISVFDWEYAGSHRPVLWDAFNFAVSSAMGRGSKVDLSACVGEPSRPDIQALYLLYLLDIGIALVRNAVTDASAPVQRSLGFEPYQGLIERVIRAC